tara:strand:- start:36685 stop:38664 length:1980 start_codon:yes stop_codon:yes gene_type:complete
MLKRIVVSVIFLVTMIAGAQKAEPFYKSYSWDETPEFSSLETDSNEDLIAFKDKIITEFYFVETGLVEFYLEHRVLWLNSDEKIEEYNKIYLPYKSNSELLVSKARVITQDGTVTTLDDSKIITAKDDESQKVYKYFALEGIEKGCFIEYYYVVRQYPIYKGKRVSLQDNHNKYNIEFDMYAPKNLIFEFKSYNKLKDIKIDTLTKSKLHWSLKLDKLNKIEKEEESSIIAEKQYLVFKLDKNSADNSLNISSYKNRAKGFYKYLYVDLDKHQVEAIDNLLKSLKLADELTEIEKIRSIENFIKSNFFITEVRSVEYEDIREIIESKTGNETGMLRLYIALLKKLDIPFEIVLTSDRFKTKFDKNFESGNFLTDYLIYFPNVDGFTSILEMDSRVGLPPFELTNNYGLFMKEIKIGQFVNGIGKIKFIKTPSEKVTKDVMVINVSFCPEDISENKIKLEREFSGYYAGYIQPYLDEINEEDKDEIFDQFIKSVNENFEIIDKKVFNDRAELFGVEPLRIVSNIKTEELTSKAGEKYLFKLGDIIGSQIEMYQEKERLLPVESDFKRSFIRKITIEIPKGYFVSNLEDINIHKYFDKDGERLLEFHSFYELNGGKLKIDVDEFYKIVRVPLEVFEEYREVVNSAADFNKIVLILEPILED